MRKNPKSDYNEENFCYECGNIITADRHFCDKECREAYVNRHKGADIVENLKKQTKFRNKIGLPHHIISPEETFSRYGKISKELPPETQKRYVEHLKVQKEIRDAYLKMKKDSTIETDMDEHKEENKYKHYKKTVSNLEDLTLNGKYMSLKLNNLLLNVQLQSGYKESIKPFILLEVTHHNLWDYRLAIETSTAKMVDTVGFQHSKARHYFGEYTRLIKRKKFEKVFFQLPESTLEAHAKTKGWIWFNGLAKGISPQRFIFTFDICEPGKTSGLVQDTETIEFILSDNNVLKLIVSTPKNILESILER